MEGDAHREFPCGLVLRIPGFHCHDPSSVSVQGTEILQAELAKKKKKKIRERDIHVSWWWFSL